MAQKGKINAKQAAFCREWLIDRNGTQAALRAGYSKRTAYSQGHDLLKHPEVKREIARLEAAQNKRLDITADKVKAEIAKIAFVDVSGIVDHFDGKRLIFRSIEDIPESIRCAIKGIKVTKDNEVSVELWSKDRALEMLAKHFNMFAEHQNAGALKVETLSDDELFEKIEAHYQTLKAKRGAK